MNHWLHAKGLAFVAYSTLMIVMMLIAAPFKDIQEIPGNFHAACLQEACLLSMVAWIVSFIVLQAHPEKATAR